MFGDDVWIADSTPVECGRSRETAKRSELAGFAEYGYCASHSRYFWGLRLHLLRTLHGLPIAAAVTGAKADERQVLLGMLDDPDLRHQIAGTTLIADKNYYGREFETTLSAAGIDLLRPTRKGEKTRPGGEFFKPLRQTVESVFDTFKGQLDLELHGGRTPAGVLTRLATRLGPHRGGLAQREHRARHQTFAGRVRPLNPWNQSSSAAAPTSALHRRRGQPDPVDRLGGLQRPLVRAVPAQARG